ncbi:hypothetical protein F5888DRAFT_1602652 [Russula emetica]|nr:hypothetical protein F5888DRAFT_1602652 [Russula emetica]
MASANPSSARLSRSTSDLSGSNRQRTPGTSSPRVDGGKNTLPRAKIQALEQFVKFGRKGKQKDKDKNNQKATEFPPPAWLNSTSISTTSASPATANTVPARAVPRRDNSSPLPPPRAPPQHPSRIGSTTGLEPPRPNPTITQDTSRRVNADVPSAAVAPSGTTHSPTLQQRRSSFPNPGSDGGDVTPPEPLTLAKRIQSLLGPQTANQASTPSATDATTSSGAAQSETAGPATPGGSIPPGDSRFLAWLGNPNVMSGSLDKGRQSVFAILDRLRPSAHGTEAPAGAAPSSKPGGEYDDREGDGSVMLYTPLVPSEDSEVELAASDIMSVYDDGETLEYEQPARPLSFAQAGEQHTPRHSSRTLPPEIPGGSAQNDGPADASQSDTRKEPGSAGWFDTLKEKVVEGGKLVSDKFSEGTKSLKDKAGEGRKIVETKTRWVPSPDKISFQATWWGYRIYLPPPVLDVLNNKRMVAAKRAAIITAALQWMLGRVPLTLVPPQFRSGVLIARRLVPYLGYIGGFIAWSWGAMRSFDKGQGIVLTATWLLPVALIPGTWEAKDTSRPPSPTATTSARSRPDS